MEAIERLLNETESDVYDLELNLLGKAKTRKGNEEGYFSLTFSKKPETQMPEKVFLRPCSNESGFISYLCALSGELKEIKNPVSGALTYTVEVFNEEAEILKDELRVYTSFRADAHIGGKRESIDVDVKDISVGGVMFITKERLNADQVLTLTFMSGRKNITADVEVKTQRPVGLQGLYGYGCRFVSLSRNQEAEIRRFVFQEDIKRNR